MNPNAMAAMVEHGRLWDQERAALEARRWAQRPCWNDFKQLRPSHVAGLLDSVRAAESAEDFRARAREYVDAAAERGNGRSLWDRASEGAPLRDHFLRALEETAKVTLAPTGRLNQSFQVACAGLGAEAIAIAERVRQLAVTREFLNALVVRYRIEEFQDGAGGQDEQRQTGFRAVE